MRHILGISAYYHDSAATLLSDGRIVAAAQEERFSRKKNDERFPRNAVAFCLKQAGLTVADLDALVFYDKPITKFILVDLGCFVSPTTTTTHTTQTRPSLNRPICNSIREPEAFSAIRMSYIILQPSVLADEFDLLSAPAWHNQQL